MKKLLFLLLFSVGVVKVNAQDVSDYDYLNGKVRIVDSNEVVVAEILPYKSTPKAKNNLYYFWYNSNIIQATQGGFSGQLLNGHYTVFYTDKKLKEDGNFKKGLKVGIWKLWNEKGALVTSVTWDKGVITVPKPPIWKRLPFISKKPAQGQAAPPAPGQ